MRPVAVRLAAVLLIVSVPHRSAAQPAAGPDQVVPAACQQALETAREATADRRAGAIDDLLHLSRHAGCYAALLAPLLIQGRDVERMAYKGFLEALERYRMDKQVGSSPGAAGTTSLVAGGVVAETASLAAEYGTVTQSVNKEIVTLSASLDGAASAFLRVPVFPYCPQGDLGERGAAQVPAPAPDPERTATQPRDAPRDRDCEHARLLAFARRLSASVALDTNVGTQALSAAPAAPAQGSTQLANFTADSHEVSQIAVRLILWNGRERTSADFSGRWAEALVPTRTPAQAATAPGPGGVSGAGLLEANDDGLIMALEPFLADVEATIAYRDWLDQAAADLQQTASAEFEGRWRRHTRDLVSLVGSANPTALTKVIDFVEALGRYQIEERRFVSDLVEEPVVTLEYDENRPVLQPSTIVFRGIVDKGIGAATALTVNGAVELYESVPTIAGSGRLRDLQAAVQVARNLSGAGWLGPIAVSGAYYYQHQNGPVLVDVLPGAPLNGISFIGLPPAVTQVFAEKGDLHAGQVKVTVGPGRSSVRFPLAITYSNRTELSAASRWSGQIGISYDFDAWFVK